MSKVKFGAGASALLVALSFALYGCPLGVPLGLVVTPLELVFHEGGGALTFTVSKSFSSRTMPAFTVTPADSWVLVNPSTGESSGPFNPVTITVQVDFTQLPPGTTTSSITVSAAGVAPKTVTVIAMRAASTPQHAITIDGNFNDWALVTAYTDPEGDEHDTDHRGRSSIPGLVRHEDVDILEYKFTHDASNLYAYLRAKGVIGRTQAGDAKGRAGRYYAIITIDVDNSDATGYWLNEGGYYPTSRGYDMNFEIEWFNGAFNTGHYLNHGARNEDELAAAFEDQKDGIVRILPGSYKYYTQWVMFDDGGFVFVQDRGPVYQGIVRVAVSEDGREAEIVAPFVGFMNDPQGNPIVALGQTIDVSLSLEASGELAADGQWASDTAQPINGYFLTP